MKIPLIFRKALERMGLSRQVTKSHVHSYVKKDGTFVREHEDSRSAHQTQTFRQWFGNSKAKNADGTPTVFYHGTNAEFTRFKKGKRRGGFYFHPEEQWARQYGQRVMAVHLKAEHTFDYENKEHLKLAMDALKSTKGFHSWMIKDMKDGDWEMVELPEVQAAIKGAGFDSYYVNDHPGKAIAVYHPTQIKSATDNNGDYSPRSPHFNKGIHGGGHPLDYKTTFQGLDISIENQVGSIRRWTNRKGESGQIKMKHAYGYIRQTQGVDGDHVDCFIGPNPDATHAYVVHAMAVPDFTQYDEDKCMLGFDSAEEAKRAFLDNYSDARFFGSMHSFPMATFIRKVLATKDHPTMIKALSPARQAEYEQETEDIRERSKTAEARKPHAFDAAEWTHKNGHPRCLVCGDEEPVGGRCAGKTITKSSAPSRLTLTFGTSSLFGKSSCGPGENCRWITIHPHGSGEGQPIRIRESKTAPGTYHVIGGAGGKLNYLKLTDVKSKEEYAQQSKVKAKDKRAKAKEQTKADKEAGTYTPKKQALDALRSDKEKTERQLVDHVAGIMGWEDYSLKPEQLEGLSDGAKNIAILRHHRQLVKDAMEVVTRTRDRLLLDHEARAEANLGELSIYRNEPDVLGLHDLEPDRIESGLGFTPQYGTRAAAAGLTEKELAEEAEEIDAQHKQELSPEKVKAGTHLKEAVARMQVEVQARAESGQLSTGERPIKNAAPSEAIKLLAMAKHVKDALAQAKDKSAAIQAGKVEPMGKALVIESEPVTSAEILAQLETDAKERDRQELSRSFLHMVEQPDEGRTVAQQGQALQRHIALGASTALTKSSQVLTGQDVLPREVIDVLGTAGAAQALAHAIHTNFVPDDVKKFSDSVTQYHSQHHEEAAQEAMAQAHELLTQAKEIQLGSVENPTELSIAHEMNERRIEKLREARSVLGNTLGELEAIAALEFALKAAPVQSIQVSLGPISTVAAIQQMRALGLDKGDYAITSDGTNQFVTIAKSGLPKLTKKPDPELARRVKETHSIMSGEQDQENWLPKGFARRPMSTYTDPNIQAVSFAQQFSTQPGGVLEDDLKSYIGSRMADGEPVHSIYQSLLSQEVLQSVSDEKRQGYFEAMDRIAPLRDETGKAQRAEVHTETFKRLAESYVKDKYGANAAPLHQQNIDMQSPKTIESLHRVLAEDPRRMMAFKPVGELTGHDQYALRDFFESRFAKGENEQKEKDSLAEMGPEPEKESEGLFGTQENPLWHEWSSKRHEIMSQAREQGLTWDKYIAMHGSRQRAYQAMQDLLKSDTSRAFADAYGKVNKTALKVGRTVIAGNLAHLDAVDPQARESRLATQKAFVDRLRNRVEGKYAAGSVKDKMDRARELAEIADQNQVNMFLAQPEDLMKPTLASDERWTLGEQAETQLQSILPQVSRNFDPLRPVTLIPDVRMDGKYVRQQRAVKLIESNKRMVMALGTGSGKTAIGLGAFTHLHDQGKVTRGIFAVPSIVQEQFGGEANNLLEPGKYHWWAEGGQTRDQRIAAYKNPEHQFVVTTHQSLRDDLVHLMAKERGIPDESMGEQFNEMNERERQATLRQTMEKEGIAWQYLNIDEGHDMLNRKGKTNSLLANVMDALSAQTPYYVSASADPIKNDVSELFDQLHKVDPVRYKDREGFLAKYGLNTNAAADALKREVMPYIFAGRVDPGVKANRQDIPVALTPYQRTQYDAVMGQYRKAKIAMSEGKTDLASLKSLSPSSFEGKDASEHDAIAKHLSASMGMIRDMALDRVIHQAPLEHNASMQEVVKRANAYREQGKPGVIFAHNLSSVASLSKVLRDAGHRVVTITGGDSSKEKGKKIKQFRPGGNKQAEADIMVVSDAGATGMNAQRGKWVIQYDLPKTAKTFWQRIGRIHRLGQTDDVDALTLNTDTILDQKNHSRLERKSGLREMLTSPYESMDETGLGAILAAQTDSPEHEAA
ncbi:MAG: helicase-related protein [Nitrospirota bacterium]|nr:helicase-related protein [Nitrospirota bacterium]